MGFAPGPRLPRTSAGNSGIHQPLGRLALTHQPTITGLPMRPSISTGESMVNQAVFVSRVLYHPTAFARFSTTRISTRGSPA